MAGKRNGLGRGLDALIRDGSTAAKQATQKKPVPATKEEGVLEVPVSKIVPGSMQPRHQFDTKALKELTQSIQEHGVLQPLLVRKKGARYELIAGERRFRAASDAGLKKVPVIELAVEDEKALEIALIENLQRQDLNPIEEAEGYALLQSKFGLTQAKVAKQVGKGRASIANALRLLELPEQLREWVSAGKISVGHAKVLLGAPSESRMMDLAQLVMDEQLSVRALEEKLKPTPKADSQTAQPHFKPKDVKDLREELSSMLGTGVKIKPSKTGADGSHESGSLQIEFKNKEELDRLLELIRK